MSPILRDLFDTFHKLLRSDLFPMDLLVAEADSPTAGEEPTTCEAEASTANVQVLHRCHQE